MAFRPVEFDDYRYKRQGYTLPTVACLHSVRAGAVRSKPNVCRIKNTMPARRRVNIIYSDNGSGLSRDAVVLRDALGVTGHSIWLTPLTPRRYPIAPNYAPELARQYFRGVTQSAARAWARTRRIWDVNIFLERLLPEYFDTARVNCLFPNQEWLTDEDRSRLGEVDLVLFRTRHAMEILSNETRTAAFVGFTSFDCRDESVMKAPMGALHVSGWNPHKGSAAVLAAWSVNPDWPELQMVSQLPLELTDAPNIKHLHTRVSDQTLRRLQNSCGVHVCPSEVEGFGHTLVEAMSCGAIVVTTAAPPMDEIVTPDEGFLVPYAATAPMGAGTRYFVDQEQLSEVLNRVWKLGPNERMRLATAARAKFDAMRASFHQRLVEALDLV